MPSEAMSSLTKEQLEERLLALHRASLDLVRDISLESLLKRIASLACEQARARYAAVGVLGVNGELEQFITIGMSQAELARMAHPPVGRGLIGVLMRSKTPLRVPDITADPRSAGFPAHHPAMKSLLGVPIRLGNEALGQIYLTDKTNGEDFSDADQLIIEMLASYAAVAISNARLYRELIQRDRVLTRRNENLALLNTMASTMSTSDDIDLIVRQSLGQLLSYLRLEVGEVFLRREDSELLQMVHHQGMLIDRLWKKDQVLIGEDIVGATARDNQPRLFTLPDKKLTALNPAVADTCLRHLACMPLTGRRGTLGVLIIATCHNQPLDELETQYLATISAWLGTAIENLRLNVQGKRLAILEERERIGMDLHDGIIQSIYAVGLTLEHARLLLNEDINGAHQRIDQAIADLNSTIRDIRAYILDLRPRQLHDEDLMQGIQRLVNEFKANTLIPVSLQGPTDGFPGMTDGEALAIFHITQEALANIAKHARAKKVELVIWKTSDRVLLEVHDDGRGFDPSRVRLAIGHGVSNMQTRARNAGGDVEIYSEPGQGTTITTWVPFHDSHAG
ncbi:MAG: GAF domain-containing protein [Chloroflexi bacterium]|nr:GAF domain-containing protein [Chloroflexota bacterium]